MKLVNLTSVVHTLRAPDGTDTKLQIGGNAAPKEIPGKLRTVEGCIVPIRDQSTWGPQIFGLIEPVPDTMYLVFPITGQAVKDTTTRTDVLLVGHLPEDLVKNAKTGQILAVKALKRIHPESGALSMTAPGPMGKVTNIVNLTTGPVTLRAPDGTDTILPMGKTAWVVSMSGKLETVPGIPVPVRTPDGFGPFSNLPAPVEGTLLIVIPSTAMGVRANTTRTDVTTTGYLPDDVVKDPKTGAILAIKALRRI